MQVYKAAKYIRLSYTDDKSNESNSVGNQRKLIEDFVSRHPEIELVSEKVDDGYSGVIFDRPAFKEMMDDIMEGKINCVIVKDLSRLGREYIETGRYMRRVFPAYGVRFIAINDNIDTLNESTGDDLTVSVKNIMNEAYARDISIKTRSSLETKRKNGDFVGAFPVYGYRKSEDNHNLLVVDEYAAQVVRSIFRMRLEGFSPYAIANELNRLGTLSPLAYKKYYGLPHAKKGYTDRKDCRWSANTVTRILQDETYTGTLVQGRKGSQHFKLKEMESRPSSEWVRVENAHEAIIDRNDFDLVQRIRNLDTRTSPQKDNVLTMFYDREKELLVLNEDNDMYETCLMTATAYLSGDCERRKELLKNAPEGIVESVKLLEKVFKYRIFDKRTFQALNNLLDDTQRKYVTHLINEEDPISAAYIAFRAGMISGKRIERAKKRKDR